MVDSEQPPGPSAVFERELDAIRADTFAAMHERLKCDLPRRLYHYGSAATLEKILKSGCLWATEGRFMNDTSELRHASAVALSFIEARWGSELHLDWLIPRLQRVVHANAFEDRHRHLVFLASFSAKRDSLSQWRAYADDGAGFALGFDLTRLHQFTGPLTDKLEEPAVDRCLYDEREQRGLIAECLQPQVAAAIGLVAQGGDRQTAFVETARSVLVSLATLGAILKQPGFEEEAEWRVLVMTRGGQEAAAIGFRNSKFGPAPYVAIPLGDPLPLTEVMLGPRVDPAVERTVRLMLDAYKCGAAVTKSRVTYR